MHALPGYFAVADLPRATGVSRAQLHRLRRAGQFPPPVYFGLFEQRWPVATVRAWTRRRRAAIRPASRRDR